METIPTIMDTIELILTFKAVIGGVLVALYFYEKTDIFMFSLKKSLRYISIGIFCIAIGVLLASSIIYVSKFGLILTFMGLPLQVYFFTFYAIGSLLIASGVRQFATNPRR